MPNINLVTEMVDMINASRNYEANLSSINTAKKMAKAALDI
jgi:flagellar basal-body rod protein FlgC